MSYGPYNTLCHTPTGLYDPLDCMKHSNTSVILTISTVNQLIFAAIMFRVFLLQDSFAEIKIRDNQMFSFFTHFTPTCSRDFVLYCESREGL